MIQEESRDCLCLRRRFLWETAKKVLPLKEDGVIHSLLTIFTLNEAYPSLDLYQGLRDRKFWKLSQSKVSDGIKKSDF